MSTFHQEFTQPGPESDRKLEFGLFMVGLNGYFPHQDEEYRTNYIDLPNGEYSQPVNSGVMIDKYLRNLVEGERLGFDMIASMEQRCPAPFNSAMIMASWLAAKTSRIKIGALGPVMNTYLNPLRLAEEVSLLDSMSGGRLSLGLPLGIGPAYFHMGVRPHEARARYREGVKLLKRAFSESGPFEHRGEFYNLPVCNLYPRPMRLPEIWTPASGSQESVELAAEEKFVYLAILNDLKGLVGNVERFRHYAEDNCGYTPPREQVAAMVLLHCAETDAQARKEAEAHLLWYNQGLMRSVKEYFLPPGYSSLDTVKRILGGGGYRSKAPQDMQFDETVDQGWALIGSPDTVARQLEEISETLGAGKVLIMGDCGTMPDWMIQKSLTMFATEVMPRFRPKRGRPVWADKPYMAPGSVAEAGAMAEAPPRRPVVDFPDVGVVDIRTAHVDELRVAIR